MLDSKFNSKVWDMYFYFTPLKTYHPRLLRTYKKVIPSCFFLVTHKPRVSNFFSSFFFLLILSLANSILKTSLIFLGFQPQNHTKEAKFLTNCGAVRVWSERSALPAVNIEYTYLDALLLNKKSALFFQTDFWLGGTIAAAAIPTRPQYFARLPT